MSSDAARLAVLGALVRQSAQRFTELMQPVRDTVQKAEGLHYLGKPIPRALLDEAEAAAVRVASRLGIVEVE